MCNYMCSLGRAKLVQEWKGLAVVRKNEELVFLSILQSEVGNATSDTETLGGGDCSEHCLSGERGHERSIRLF